MAERNWLENIINLLVGEPTDSLTGQPYSMGIATPGLGGAGRSLAPRAASPGTSLVPRPSYAGVRVTNGTSIVPKDAGWRYGGPNWRFADQASNFGGAQARQARSVAQGARDPSRALVPRTGTSITPRTGTSITPRTGSSLVSAGGNGRTVINYPAALQRSGGMDPNIARLLAGGGALDLGGSALRQEPESAEASPRGGSAQSLPPPLTMRQRAIEEDIDNPTPAGWIPAESPRDNMGPNGGTDPYTEFLESQMAALGESYDQQIGAVAGLGPIFQEMAQESQSNIGDFFGFAEQTARDGMPVVDQIYSDAGGNLDEIYNRLGGRLEAMPQQMTDIASQAAGGAVGRSVADNVAAATAPFAAAGETARANSQENLTRSSAAGQNYLNNLASAVPAEGALHQSAVEQALNQQMQMVAYRQAELEGAKQRALMGVAADIAGSTSEQVANQALAAALGLEGLPGNVDPLDYLSGMGRMQGMQEDEMGAAQDELRFKQDTFDFEKDMNPNFREDQIMASLSVPSRNIFSQMLSSAEDKVAASSGTIDMSMALLESLDNMVESGLGANSSPSMARTGLWPGEDNIEEELRRAIRGLTS